MISAFLFSKFSLPESGSLFISMVCIAIMFGPVKHSTYLRIYKGENIRKKYQKRERQERRLLRGCIFLFLFTSGRVQYLKSSSSSWKSCTLLTTFSDWPYSDFRAVFFIIIAPGRLTSFLQILMNSFLQSGRQ